MKKSYEITTGANFFYTKEEKLFGVYQTIELTEKVDGRILQETADLFMKRFPYFKTKISLSDAKDRYVLETNTNPFVVYEMEDFLPFYDERANEYLITLTYSGTHINFMVFHGLSDGMGIAKVLKVFVHTYICKHTGRQLECADIIDIYGEVDEAEYSDPYELVPETADLPSIKPLAFEEPFSFKPEDMRDSGHRLYTLSIQSKEMYKIAAKAEGSVSGLLALVLGRAVETINANLEKPIAMFCALDLKKILHSENNLRNSCMGLHYVYSKKLKKYPVDVQLSALKGMLYRQIMPECQLPFFASERDLLRKANAANSIEEKKDIFLENSVLSNLPALGYMGELQMGECSAYIKNIAMYAKVVGLAGVAIIGLVVDDRCMITITSTLKNDDYYNAFLGELDKLGLPYEIGEVKDI